MHCDPNAYCLLIPETSDFKCECKPGYNGTGKVCKGMILFFNMDLMLNYTYKLYSINFQKGFIAKGRVVYLCIDTMDVCVFGHLL